jgi:hypothetical protein
MKNIAFNNQVFKFHSEKLPYIKGDAVRPDVLLSAHGRDYFFPKGGKVVAIFEDPEQPIQEPKMCVQIKSL